MNAPASIILTTAPSKISPISGSKQMSLIIAIAFLIASPLLPEILTKPVSSISTTAPLVAQISLITLPREPITSLILAGEIFKLSTRGTLAENSFLASGKASFILPRICILPSLACASACFMMSKLIPLILMSI